MSIFVIEYLDDSDMTADSWHINDMTYGDNREVNYLDIVEYCDATYTVFVKCDSLPNAFSKGYQLIIDYIKDNIRVVPSEDSWKSIKTKLTKIDKFRLNI